MTFRHGARGFGDVFARRAVISILWHRALGCKGLICECVRVHDRAERVAEDVWIIAVVEPPLKLFEVAVHVLRADLVERTDEYNA